ncbi:MAG: 50S ribosomal protein L23 [Tenacibaculum sp.]
MSILIKPVITEKALKDSEKFNRYTFIVNKNANKPKIKSAVESFYGVTVLSVKTLIHPIKKKIKYNKKKGAVKGSKSAYKKAVVQLEESHTIDFYNNL